MALTTPLSSKRKLGFGLCQVNKIVEKLHGSIFIRSVDSSISIVYKKKQSTSHSFLKNNLITFPGTQISISLTG